MPLGLWLHVLKPSCYCFVVYTEIHRLAEVVFLFMNPNSLCWTPQHPAVIASIARQINLDSATRLLLFSLFITRYTDFN